MRSSKKVTSLEPRDESQLDPKRCGTQLLKSPFSSIILSYQSHKTMSPRHHPHRSRRPTHSTKMPSLLGWSNGLDQMISPSPSELERFPFKFSAITPDLPRISIFVSLKLVSQYFLFCLVIFTQIRINLFVLCYQSLGACCGVRFLPQRPSVFYRNVRPFSTATSVRFLPQRPSVFYRNVCPLL